MIDFWDVWLAVHIYRDSLFFSEDVQGDPAVGFLWWRRSFRAVVSDRLAIWFTAPRRLHVPHSSLAGFWTNHTAECCGKTGSLCVCVFICFEFTQIFKLSTSTFSNLWLSVCETHIRSIQWKSMGSKIDFHCIDQTIRQNVYYVLQKTESHTGLEQHKVFLLGKLSL